MGRSGSGKTTVTRLLQGLHSNYDRADQDRRQRSARDRPRSSALAASASCCRTISCSAARSARRSPPRSRTRRFEEIVYAARLAGAEEFIEHLPRGYETFIQEGSPTCPAANGSGSRSPARLIGDPRMLILDEATSALDADSEAIVNANLLRIAEGRTLIIISHRLSALVPPTRSSCSSAARSTPPGRTRSCSSAATSTRALAPAEPSSSTQADSHGIVPLRAGAAQ